MTKKYITLAVPTGMYREAILEYIIDAAQFLLEEDDGFIQEVTSSPSSQDELYAGQIYKAIKENPKKRKTHI